MSKVYRGLFLRVVQTISWAEGQEAKCLAFLATVGRSKGVLSFLSSNRKRSHEPAGQLLNRGATITNVSKM